MAQRLIKIQADRNLVARQVSLFPIEEGFIQKARLTVVVSVWGGKIVCRTKNLWSECEVLYTHCCYTFPFTFVGGDVLCTVDLYFKFKDKFNYFIYYFIC